MYMHVGRVLFVENTHTINYSSHGIPVWLQKTSITGGCGAGLVLLGERQLMIPNLPLPRLLTPRKVACSLTSFWGFKAKGFRVMRFYESIYKGVSITWECHFRPQLTHFCCYGDPNKGPAPFLKNLYPIYDPMYLVIPISTLKSALKIPLAPSEGRP